MGQYDDLFEPARPNPALAVRLNADANPDQEAEYLKLAKRYKVPTPLVQTFPDEYKARAKADDVDEITRPAPKLRGWLSESTNAKLALDDVSPLTEIEQAVKRYGELKAWNGPEPTAMNVLKGLAKSFPQGFNAMKAGLNVQMADFLESVGLVTPDPLYKADRERKLRQAMGAPEFTTPDFESSTARGVYGGVSSLLRQLPGLAATIATRSPTPAMVALGVQTQGEAYGKYRARGATGGEAFFGAGGETLVELATEYLPSKYIADAFGNAPVRDFIVNFLKKEAPGEQAATLLQDAIDTAIANPDKTWAQYLQERPEAAYQTLVATLTQTGLMAGANSIVRSIAESGKGEAAEEDAKQLADLLKTAGSALLRERSPEQFRELMGQMSDGAVIHVDGAVLNQLAPEVLAALPESVRNEIATAAAIDTTVAIPVADVLTVAPGTPLEQVLVENARMTPDAESQASAKAAAEAQANVLMQQAERVMQQAADQETMRASAEVVRTSILTELNATGRYRPAVAEGMSQWAGAFYTTMASRVGMTPEAFYQKYRLRILGEPSSAGQQVMDQTTSLDAVRAQWDAAGVQHSITEKKGVITLGRIVVPEGQRAQGLGSQAMQALLAYADATGQRIELGASSQLGGDKVRLVEFYERFGFERKPRSAPVSKPFKDTAMVRAPRAPAVLNQTPGALPAWSKMKVKGARITDAVKKGAISLSPKATLARRNYEKLDAIFKKVPNPLESEQAWLKFQSLLVADGEVLGVPYAALKYAQSPAAVAEYLSRLRPDQLESRRAGFALGSKIRAQYAAGNATPLITGRLLLWAMLSRKAGAYPHEAAYTDLVNGGVDEWIQKAVDGNWTEVDQGGYVKWSSEFMASKKGGASPSAGVTSNANDFGRILLTKMSEKDESGQTQLTRLHNMIADQSVSTDQVRREFFALGDGLGIQNKVLSFALLVTGRWDTLVLDRVQFTHLWGDTYRERAGQRNIYDLGLAAAGDGHFGLAVYEALARGMSESVRQGYADAGLTGEGDGTLGAFHWDSWLIESSQAIGHPTIEALTTDSPRPDLAVRQGKFDTYSYNFEYRADGQYQIPLLDGSGYRIMSPAEAAEFMGRLKDDKEGVVPKNFGVASNKSAPWVDAEGVDRARYDAILNEYGRRADAGDVAPAGLADAGGSVQGDAAPAAGSDIAAAGVLNQSAGFDRFVGNATRVDLGDAHEFKAGEPVVVAALHGTTGDFTTFDTAMANIESDLGGGFYFTNNPADVGENYAGMGPDLTNKIQGEAERLESNDDLDPDEAMQIARDKWMANEGLTMPVWVKMQKPVVLGGSRETFLTYEESYDEETDEYGEPTGDLIAVIEALREVASDERYGDADIEQTIGELREKAMEGGGISARELITTAKLSEGLVYATDYESDGKLAPQEILRRAFEAAGFDGFIDQTVDEKFGSTSEGQRKYGKGMKGMDENTVHFIAFTPTQIKSRLGNSGAFDESKPDILKQGPRGTFNPRSLELVLNPNANLSTFFHETGHFFLEVLADIASQPNPPAQIAEDMATFLKWAGVADLQTWNSLDLEGKRASHERWAESIEQYVMEGKAPSVELQPLMRRFATWLKSVYGSIQKMLQMRGAEADPVQLNDDIRRVMDRMLATDEQIAQANEVAGLVPELEADAAAAERLAKRSMADLKWQVRARDQVIGKLRKEAAAIEKDIRQQVTVEVDQTPEMRAKAALDALQVTPEFAAILAEHKARRAAAQKQAEADVKAALLADNPDAKGLVKGQLLAKNKRDMANKVEAAMIKWDAANPAPKRPVNATDADVATIADSFGFEGVDAMLQAIDAFGSRTDAIDGLTQQRMLEEHGDLVDDRAIQQAANEAVHNEARARSLATELRTQREMLNPRADTGETNAKGQKITVNALVEAAKQFAAKVVGGTAVADLRGKTWQHTAAERRASKRWTEATSAGKTEEAVKAKQDQMLNHAAAKAALDAQAEVKKITEFFARVAKGNDEKVVKGGRDADIVNAARAVLAAYGMETGTTKRAAEYLETVKTNDPDTFNTIAPMVDAAVQNAQPMAALTVDELRTLNEHIAALWYLAKRTRQMEVDGDTLELDDVEDVVFARLEEIGIPDRIPGEGKAITAKESRIRKLREMRLNLTRVEQWAEAMDGKAGGVIWRHVFLPIKAAADRVRARRIGVYRKLEDATKAVAPSIAVGKIDAPEIGYVFGEGVSHNGVGMAELLPALLNVGNESNKRKLLLGRKWATENADGTLDTTQWDAFINRLHSTGALTKAHWDYVQAWWDVLESLKPAAQEAHRKVFGRYFSEVTAESFDTPFGIYKGGYYPAQTDTEQVTEINLKKLAEMENENMSYSFPSVNRGFTKERVEYNRPLKLDMNVGFQHVDKVILFAEMQPAAQGLGRLLKRKKISQPLERIMPGVYEALLIPWSNDAAKQIVERPVLGDGGFNRGATILRSRVGMQLMMGNLLNAVQQVSGVPAIAGKLEADGLKRSALRKALVKWVAHPVQFSKDVWAESTYMKDRAENDVAAMSDTVNEILFNPSLLEKGEKFTRKHAYFIQTWFDNRIAPIAWQAGYDAWREAQPKVDATGMTVAQLEALEARQHREAVLYADGLVRQTQGSQLPEDVSRFERGIGVIRLFTQFAGYFNMQANTNAASIVKLAEQGGLKKNAGRGFYVLMAGLLAPIWIAEVIGLAMRGGADDEDKDGQVWDDWLRSVFGLGTFRGLVAMVPVGGQIAAAAVNRFNSNPADDRISLSPTVSVFEALGSGLYQVGRGAMGEDVNAQRLVKDFALVAGTATGLPFFLLSRPAGYVTGVAEDRIEPTGPADFTRGLITGTASPESKQR